MTFARICVRLVKRAVYGVARFLSGLGPDVKMIQCFQTRAKHAQVPHFHSLRSAIAHCFRLFNLGDQQQQLQLRQRQQLTSSKKQVFANNSQTISKLAE